MSNELRTATALLSTRTKARQGKANERDVLLAGHLSREARAAALAFTIVRVLDLIRVLREMVLREMVLREMVLREMVLREMVLREMVPSVAPFGRISRTLETCEGCLVTLPRDRTSRPGELWPAAKCGDSPVILWFF